MMDNDETTVEIGGQCMTQAQFDAARFPLLVGDPGLVGLTDEARWTPDLDAPSPVTAPGPTEPTAAEIEAAARALFKVQHDTAGEWWDWLTDRGRREWCDDARTILAAALPLVEARLREEMVGDIDAEYLKVAADEGATLESDRIITAICNGLLRARRVVRGR